MGHPGTIVFGNKYMTKVKTYEYADFPPAAGRRGTMKGFSPGQRMRMLQFFNTIDREAMGRPLMVTLTYPAQYPPVSVAKGHLRALVKRIERKEGPEVCSVVRMERQERGAVHFHLLVFGVPENFLDMNWLNRNWGEVVGPDYQDGTTGLPPFTDVQAVRTWRGVFFYAAKYLAKLDKPADGDRGGGPVPPPEGGGPAAVDGSPSLSLSISHSGPLGEEQEKEGKQWWVTNRKAFKLLPLRKIGELTIDQGRTFRNSVYLAEYGSEFFDSKPDFYQKASFTKFHTKNVSAKDVENLIGFCKKITVSTGAIPHDADEVSAAI